MDVTSFLELKPAPRVLTERLKTLSSRPRFLLPTADGDWTVVTWGAFGKQVRHMALFLASQGFGGGERAAIFAANRVEWISAALAIQAAGGVMVPVYPSNTAELAAYVTRHSDSRVLFVDGAALLAKVFERWDEYADVKRFVLLDDALDPSKVLASVREKLGKAPSAADVEARVLTFCRALALGAARDAEDPKAYDRMIDAISLDQGAVMLYTSGTSGNPKGVPLTHRNVGVNGSDWLRCNAPLIEEGMVDLLWLPMSHIFGFGEACLGNTLGWTSYLADPMTVLAKLPIVRPHVLMSVPSIWEKLSSAAAKESEPERRKEKLAEVTGGNLRFCLSGGAGLKREVKELFHSTGLLIIEGYGLTEASPTITLNRPDAFRFDSVGKVLPSVDVKLAEDGEILARGPSVFAGYHKDPNGTADVFTDDGWLKTGDVGRFTDDGFLQIIDRKKDILVTAGGKNVAPANIEVRFQDDPFIAHLVVYGDAQRFLVAGVWLHTQAVDAALAGVPANARTEAIAALVQKRIDGVNAQLASYETIKKFHVFDRALTVADHFLTPTLKVRRKKVYEAFGRELDALYA